MDTLPCIASKLVLCKISAGGKWQREKGDIRVVSTTYISEQLNGCFDETGKEQSDKDETSQQHPRGLKFLLREQDDHEDNKEQSK